MSPELAITLHAWRGIGTDNQLSLFYVALRLGFLTVSYARSWWLPAYRKNRNALEARVQWDREQSWTSHTATKGGA